MCLSSFLHVGCVFFYYLLRGELCIENILTSILKNTKAFVL